jgi:hypothetical protein
MGAILHARGYGGEGDDAFAAGADVLSRGSGLDRLRCGRGADFTEQG